MKEKKQKKSKNVWLWPVKILLLALFFSFSFSIISVLALNSASIAVAVIIVLIFILLGMFFDMIGLAVASCSLDPFTAMASRKVKGSKQAIALIKNADKVNSILNDVFGDICGILAGAAGASIVASIALASNNNIWAIIIPSIISAVIAGLTIFGKAILKRIAITHCNSITLKFAKFLNFFTHIG